MSGVADLHVLFALENGWPHFRDNRNEFKALFRGVKSALLDEWHAAMVASPPVFRDEAGKGKPEKDEEERKRPWVIVSLADEEPGERFLGDSGGTDSDTGRQRREMAVTQDVRVTIMSKNAELTRVLHVVIRAIMLLATKHFLKDAYEDFQYRGVDRLSADEELLTVDLGVFMRAQRYTAKSIVSVLEPADTALLGFDWYVQLSDVEMDPDWPVVDGKLPEGTAIPATGAGTPGGVIPADD